MFEKCNPSHPDKIADRIAGAIVDLAYKKLTNPKIAVEVLIGHKYCYIVLETNTPIDKQEIIDVVNRITRTKDFTIAINDNNQDIHLAENQEGIFRCGDNGIFKGVPIIYEQRRLSVLARVLYEIYYPYDGKFILDDKANKLTICQSNAKAEDIKEKLKELMEEVPQELNINPLGEWTGGTDVDTGATNRKLGSDMGDAVTGGGLHGKDLSKADVTLNIYAHLKAQKTGEVVELSCSIGDEVVDGKPYSEIVGIARKYIKEVGGFEKFAEWGLI